MARLDPKATIPAVVTIFGLKLMAGSRRKENGA
jgi:hypothetical protein